MVKMYPILKLQKIVNDYQQDSGVLYTFVPNKPFGRLLEISPTNHIFLKHFTQNMMKLKYG